MDLTPFEHQAREHIRKLCRIHIEFTGRKLGRPVTFDYRFEHTRAAVGVADVLAREVGLEPALARIAAWLHDVARCWDPNLAEEENRARFRDHGAAGGREAAAFLSAIGFPPHLTCQVEQAITAHVGYFKDYTLEEPLAAVIWDADKLTKISAAGLVHFLAVQLVYQDKLVDMEQYFSHDDGMRQRIRDSLNLEYSKQWADRELATVKEIEKQVVRSLQGMALN